MNRARGSNRTATSRATSPSPTRGRDAVEPEGEVAHDLGDRATADAAMKPDERAELKRQGAKAAARGDARASNPILETINTPPSTGESLREWDCRRDAWEAGFDSQGRARRRPAAE